MRPVVPSLTPLLRRSVVHHARPPRMPIQRGPHAAPISRPTEGTVVPTPGTRPVGPATAAIGDDLTFVYAPPPTAPSYTQGTKPELFRWIDGEGVQLTGEERAPLRRARKTEVAGVVGWEAARVGEMREMRAKGMSRREIADALSIPPEQSHLIARVAPLSPTQAAAKDAALARQKHKWGQRKSIHREIRERRKEFW